LSKRLNRLVYGHYKYRQYEKNEKYDEVNEFKSKSINQILDSIKGE
jgi:hypothetical protein